MRRVSPLFAAVFALVSCAGPLEDPGPVGQSQAALEAVANGDGVAETAHAAGAIDRTNPFFENFGGNGRTCETCHDARAAWTTSASLSKQLFNSTGGTHPLFVSLHDTGNRPDADTSTLDAKREAFSTLLQHGLHRFTRTIPATAEFEVIAVDDPYGWSTPASFANFRRAGTNMGFVSKVAGSTTTGTPNPTVRDQLVGLMQGATTFHTQLAVVVPAAKQQAGADFMMGLAFAQSVDDKAGALDADGARGGPNHLLAQPIVAGRFDLFDAWENADDNSPQAKRRAQIARGQKLFNELQFDVSGVAGLNDATRPVIRTTCNGCHRTANVGTSTSARFMNIGTADASRRPDFLPLVTVRLKATGETVQTTDLGRALNTRLFADIGKVRVLGLRGLASRAPYFHNGSARDLGAVIRFYDERFDLKLKGHEKQDLESFLSAL